MFFYRWIEKCEVIFITFLLQSKYTSFSEFERKYVKIVKIIKYRIFTVENFRMKISNDIFKFYFVHQFSRINEFSANKILLYLKFCQVDPCNIFFRFYRNHWRINVFRKMLGNVCVGKQRLLSSRFEKVLFWIMEDMGWIKFYVAPSVSDWRSPL